ncbi:uncharacterized protein LOC5503183 isoform X1 [Nematostella vectensis]|uniref:uncharacterized protein LOC5503183 isoform X1 n=1 Tax=Nematostella vectensis TaxID=45351 RepID=UPI00207723DA|nr:uncharacterized protein LOC5503183 isoform X1 [Nematostella vectensis]
MSPQALSVRVLSARCSFVLVIEQLFVQIMAEAIKQRETLYKLIISQLHYDGCEAVAAALAKTTNIISPCPPCARLLEIVNLGLAAEAEGAKPGQTNLPGLTLPPANDLATKGIDLEYESDECNGTSTNGSKERHTQNTDMKRVHKVMNNGIHSEIGRENIPPLEEVRRHILKITTSKIAAEEINVVSSNGEHLVIGNGLSADDVCAQVKLELQKMNVSQEVFAKCVLGKTQGYLSEMLKHGEKVFCPSEKSSSKGRMNFERMRQFLARPESERRNIYSEMAQRLREQRMQRKRLTYSMVGSPLGLSPKKYRLVSEEARCLMDEYYSNSSHDSIDDYTDRPSMIKDEPRADRLAASCSKLNSVSNDDAEFFRRLDIRKRLDFSDHQFESKESSSAETKSRDQPSRKMFLASHSAPTFIKSEFMSPLKPDNTRVTQTSPSLKPTRCDKDLIANKIAALSRNQPLPKSSPRMPMLIPTSPTTKEEDRVSQATVKTETEEPAMPSPAMPSPDFPSTSQETMLIESLPLESLADIDSSIDPLVMPDNQGDEGSRVELGQQIYVVRVEGTNTISVTSSY